MFLTQKKKKVVNATYILHPGVAYNVNKVSYDIQDAAIDSLLRIGQMLWNGSLLKAGERFDVSNLEGNGISEEVRAMVTHPLLIPRFRQGESAESLNVAVATAITCSEFCRR